MMNGRVGVKHPNYDFDSLQVKENLETGKLSSEAASVISKEMRNISTGMNIKIDQQTDKLENLIKESNDHLVKEIDRRIKEGMGRLTNKFGAMIIGAAGLVSAIYEAFHVIK